MVDAAREQCIEAENQAAALRSMTQRMILTEEEMVSSFGFNCFS